MLTNGSSGYTANMSSTLWDELGRIIGERGMCPPAREAHALTVFGQLEYLPMVIEQLTQHMVAQMEAVGEPWCGYVSYDRPVDVEQITLPVLLEKLKAFSQDGKIEDLLEALAQVTHLATREFLRRGQLPVMYPVGRVPSTPVSEGPYPIVGTFVVFSARH